MTGLKQASRADIEAILAARKNGTIESTADVRSIPALPPQKPTSTPASLQAQSVPLTQPVAPAPAPVPAPTPKVSDTEVSAFLEKHLPALIKAGVDLATPPFVWGEVITLGQVVSDAVREGLPQVKGAEARALVVVIVRYVWRTYATPLLPVMARPFAGLLESLIIAGIEAAYQLAVKRK
jgi:hypothetical protein